MSYQTGNHPASTPFRTTLASILTAAGFVQVTANYSPQTNWLIDVWKSPGTLNAAGQDWYLIVGDQISGASRVCQLTVCEGWDDATKTATKYIPTTNNVAPAADFSVGAGAVAPTSANLFYVQVTSWTDTTGTVYKVSATVDRVVVQIGAALATVYCGQVDKTYPAAVDPVALVAVPLGIAGFNTTAASVGGQTREPAQTVASASNFRVQFNSSATASFSLLSSVYCANADAVTGKALLSPLVLSCSRLLSNGHRRALMKDVRTNEGGATGADTATEIQPDGSTRNFFVVNTSWGVFAGQL